MMVFAGLLREGLDAPIEQQVRVGRSEFAIPAKEEIQVRELMLERLFKPEAGQMSESNLAEKRRAEKWRPPALSAPFFCRPFFRFPRFAIHLNPHFFRQPG
jgi:hypothetical protein